MCPTRAEGISCEIPSTMPSPARRIGTSGSFFVTSYAISIAISLTSCLKSRVLVRLSRRIVSLCWINGCASTVRLGNSRDAALAMGEEATYFLRPSLVGVAVMKRLLLVALLAVIASPAVAQAPRKRIAALAMGEEATYFLRPSLVGVAVMKRGTEKIR